MKRAHGCISMKRLRFHHNIKLFCSLELCVCPQLCLNFGIPCTIAHYIPLSMETSRQEYRNGLPFPTPGDLQDLRIESRPLVSPALGGGLFRNESPEKSFSSVQFSWSVVLTLCNPKNCSTLGLPVHPQLPVYTNTCPLSR